jgi:hypothetical protein
MIVEIVDGAIDADDAAIEGVIVGGRYDASRAR